MAARARDPIKAGGADQASQRLGAERSRPQKVSESGRVRSMRHQLGIGLTRARARHAKKLSG